MPRIPIVDENDTLIGMKERNELAPEDIYRVTTLWITNTNGDILLAQRALTKRDGGKWAPAVAGTVEEGESYDDNIIKEIREEIGLTVTLAELKRGPKLKIIGSARNFYIQWYFYTIDKPAQEFIVELKEVALLRWISRKKLLATFKEQPEVFIPSTPQWIQHIMS